MNYEQKYLKYKSKYNQLKNQLKGGACNPAPNPTDNEHISLDQYQNIPVNRLETFGGHCYDIVQLGNWIHFAVNATYPATNLPMNDIDKWNVITAYNAFRTAHDPTLPNHFIYTPVESAQIIAAVANPPVPNDISNLINNIRRGVVPPVAYVSPIINATPAQMIIFNNIIPVAPAALVPGTIYIGYHISRNYYYRTDPFINISGADGLVRFGNAQGISGHNPATVRYYNIADLVTNGLPLPP
jgi:hypothetical protein